MSITIPISSLSTEQKEIIKKCLTIIPKKPWVPGRTWQFRDDSQDKGPVIFYQLEGDIIKLPYRFGVAILGKFPRDISPLSSALWCFTGSLFEHQKPIAEQALKHLESTGCVTLKLHPSAGKTVLGTFLSSKVAGKGITLVMHPRELLNSSWKNTFLEFSNTVPWVVSESKTPTEKPNVIIVIDKSVGNIPKEWLKLVDVLILDEVHLLCTHSRVSALLATSPKYIIAETATLERDDELHKMAYSLCGEHSVIKEWNKPFQVYKIETGIDPPIRNQKNGSMNWNALVSDLCSSPERNELIKKIVLSNVQAHKILILTWRVEHAKKLCEILTAEGIKTDYLAGSKGKYSDSNVLIGTVQKVGTGFDEKMACIDFGDQKIDVLIYAASTKKPAVIEQNVGRVFRADMPNVVHLVDKFPAISKSHWAVAKKWYLSRGGQITEFICEPPKTPCYNTEGEIVGYAEVPNGN